MTQWLDPPGSSALEAGDVHVWRAALDIPVGKLRSVLSPDERERADHFHFDRDRHRFTVARAALRILLSRYLAMPPEAVEFRYGGHGKPSVAGEIEFNVAHSGDLALYAFAERQPVGVDLEQMRPGPLEDGVADRFFSPREAAALRSLPEEARREAFYRCWTRKEAFVKANGKGLGYGLDKFTVSLVPDEPAALLEIADEPAEAPRWNLFHLSPGPGYVGALAIRDAAPRVRCWRWDNESS